MRNRSMGALVALLLVLTACAGSTDTPAPADGSSVGSRSPAAAYPQTLTDDDGQPVTIDAMPQRIVTFAPSMTEIVFALGHGRSRGRRVGQVRRLPGGGQVDPRGRRRRRLRRGSEHRRGRVAATRPVPHHRRRRSVEATPPGPRHPRGDPGRDGLPGSAARHPDGRRPDRRTGGGRRADGGHAAPCGRCRCIGRTGRRTGHVLLRGLLPAAHHPRPEHVHLRSAEAGGVRSGDGVGEDGLPDVVDREARGGEPRRVPQHAGVREERPGRRRAGPGSTRSRRSPRDVSSWWTPIW